MKTLKLLLLLVATFVVIYLIGIIAATFGNSVSAYDNYPRTVAELGFVFRLLIVVVLSAVVWWRATDRSELVLGLVCAEVLTIVLATVGHMFGSSEFVFGVPIGLIVQDILTQIGVGSLIKRRSRNNEP